MKDMDSIEKAERQRQVFAIKFEPFLPCTTLDCGGRATVATAHYNAAINAWEMWPLCRRASEAARCNIEGIAKKARSNMEQQISPFERGDRVEEPRNYGVGTVRYLDDDLALDGKPYHWPGQVCVEFDREINGTRPFMWCKYEMLRIVSSVKGACEMNQQMYTVHTCGTTKQFYAATPEEAAAMMLQDRGWTSTRSIGVWTRERRLDFLDCELVDGVLQFTCRNALP